MDNRDSFIDRIRRLIADPAYAADGAGVIPPRIAPVATQEAIDAAEETLGFPLPPLLRRLYLEVGNGGYGPGYGIIGLPGGATDDVGLNLLDLYEEQASVAWRSSFPRWPDRILRTAYFGCAMYGCVDCSSKRYPVLLFEPNPSEEDLGFANNLIPGPRDFDDWMEAWVSGEDLMNDFFPGYTS